MTYDQLIDALDEYREGENRFAAPMSNNRRFIIIQKVEREPDSVYETLSIITETLKGNGDVQHAIGSVGYTPKELIDAIRHRELHKDGVEWERL